MKRLMKKNSITKEDIRSIIDSGEIPSEEQIIDAIESEPERTEGILGLVLHHLGNISDTIQMVAVKNKPSSIRLMENATEDVQKYILTSNPGLIHLIQNPTREVLEYELKPHVRHDWHNRDWAIMYIDGEIYGGKSHPDCLKTYYTHKEEQEVNISHRRELGEYVEKNDIDTPLACAALVQDGVFDHTDVKKAIYIDPTTLFNVTIEEVVDAMKKKYPDYSIYNDDEYEIDVENQKIKYNRLAKLRKLMERKP